MSAQRAPQQNGCQCGMCFFLAMEGSKYCVAHRGIMESFDRKRAAPLPESQPREQVIQECGFCESTHLCPPNQGIILTDDKAVPESQPTHRPMDAFIEKLITEVEETGIDEEYSEQKEESHQTSTSSPRQADGEVREDGSPSARPSTSERSESPSQALAPESQPSPSGDFHKELREKISLLKLYPDMNAQEFYERMEEFIVRVLRSHDAKVSGQVEQRLRKALEQLIVRSYAEVPDKDGAIKWVCLECCVSPWTDTLEECRKLHEPKCPVGLAEAALQERPSD